MIDEYELEIYQTRFGKRPFEAWLNKLKDHQGVAAIKIRLNRVKLGNLGDTKPVGNSVYELKIKFGPGYRVYYSQIGKKILLLLCGGDKRSQEKDIKIAKEYLQDFAIRREPDVKK